MWIKIVADRLDSPCVPSAIEVTTGANDEDELGAVPASIVKIEEEESDHKGKRRRKTSPNSPASQDMLLSCFPAAEKYNCLFVQNTVSKRRRILMSEQGMRPRGCKCDFSDKPHKIYWKATEVDFETAQTCGVLRVAKLRISTNNNSPRAVSYIFASLPAPALDILKQRSYFQPHHLPFGCTFLSVIFVCRASS